MREHLLIRVAQHQTQPIDWLVYSHHEQDIIASGQLQHAEELIELQEKARSREVILLLPASQVQLKTVNLPTKWGRKLEQALPYMLEEQLASDIDDLFIATGSAHSNGEQHSIDVALTDKAWFANWLSTLSAVDIQVQRVLPDALLLPTPTEGHATAIQLGEGLAIRTGKWQIANVEPLWLTSYLSTLNIDALDHYSPLEMANTPLQLNAQQAEYDLPLALFARELPQCHFNLRQGEFTYKKQRYAWLKVWRPALVASVITVCFGLAVKGAELHHLNSKNAQLKANTLALYKQAFPQTRVRPQLLKNTIKEQLKAVNQGADVSFLTLLQAFADVIGEQQNFTTQNLRYDQRRSELRVRAVGKNFQAFGAVKSSLEKRGFEVSQGSLNNDGDSVVGELRVRGI